MTRPIGITVLSVVLGWLAVAGVGNAIVWNLGAVHNMASQIPSSGPLPTLGGPILAVLALAYGISAAASCIALWRMRPWAARAYGTWCVAVLAVGAWMAMHGFAPSLLTGLLFAVCMFVIVALGYPYVARKIPSRAT